MIRFIKMQGIGNDYIYVNAFAQRVDDPAELARRMSDRHFGIGSDGLILVCPPSPDIAADVRMRMFNADGSEAEMCGNGIRCVCKLAHDDGLSRANPMRIETGRGVLTLDYTLDDVGKVDQVTVDMGAPILDAVKIPVELPPSPHPPHSSHPPRPSHPARIIDAPLWQHIPEPPAWSPGDWKRGCGLDERMTCVSMGNPHLVIFCERVDGVPLEWIGPLLETQPIFPQRINVHFVQVHSREEVTMRTWERGSGITLACGTGAAAVCVAGMLTNRTEREILAHLPGGDLRLRWDEQTTHVFKTGPAREVFRGEWPESGDREATPGVQRARPADRLAASR